MLSLEIEKTFRLGAAILSIGFVLLAACLAVFMQNGLAPSLSLGKKGGADCEPRALSIPFGLQEKGHCIPLPNLEGEMSFSLDRSRPDSEFVSDAVYTLRFKKSGQWKRITVPAQIGLKYERGLQFSDQSDFFWVDLQENGARQIAAKVFVCDLTDAVVEAGTFLIPIEEPPVRLPSELGDKPAFKALSESRLLGKDLFLSKYGDGNSLQRIEIGSGSAAEQIAVKEGDCFAWIDNKWRKIASPEEGKGVPLARVSSFDERSLLFDAWDLAEYVRFSVSSAAPIPLKTKGEEFLTAVRVRSEKQISCMLEKQCFVLRAGDWVLKEEARWRVLRKPQEKEACLQGKLMGELFVFDRIDVKGGQKIVQGALFNQERSQMQFIEASVNGQGKNGAAKEMPMARKGKGK